MRSWITLPAAIGQEGDIELLEEIGNAVKTGSLCGLGQTAPNPVLTTIRYFRDEYEAHIREKACPAGVCKELITFYIVPEKCPGCSLCRALLQLQRNQRREGQAVYH